MIALADEIFLRTEKKYLVPRELGEELDKLLERNLGAAYPADTTRFTLVESIYFDSNERAFYGNNYELVASRCKIRARRYGPNGQWNEKSLHLEFKSKSDGKSFKERLQLTPALLQGLLLGVPLANTLLLRNLNKNISSHICEQRIAKINSYFKEFALEPTCRVSYERHAFERNGFRATYDKNLGSEVLIDGGSAITQKIKGKPCWENAFPTRQRYLNAKPLVLELKHAHTIPQVIADFLSEHSLQEVRFSKYCFALSEFVHNLDEGAKTNLLRA